MYYCIESYQFSIMNSETKNVHFEIIIFIFFLFNWQEQIYKRLKPLDSLIGENKNRKKSYAWLGINVKIYKTIHK